MNQLIECVKSKLSVNNCLDLPNIIELDGDLEAERAFEAAYVREVLAEIGATDVSFEFNCWESHEYRAGILFKWQDHECFLSLFYSFTLQEGSLTCDGKEIFRDENFY